MQKYDSISLSQSPAYKKHNEDESLRQCCMQEAEITKGSTRQQSHWHTYCHAMTVVEQPNRAQYYLSRTDSLSLCDWK